MLSGIHFFIEFGWFENKQNWDFLLFDGELKIGNVKMLLLLWGVGDSNELMCLEQSGIWNMGFI